MAVMAVVGSPAMGYVVEQWDQQALYQAEGFEHQAGERVRDADASDGFAWAAGSESSGKYIVLGNPVKAPSGRYKLVCRMKLNAAAEGEVAKLDMYDREGERLPALTIRAKDFGRAGEYHDFEIEFDWEYSERDLELRCQSLGKADVWIDYLALVRRTGWLEVGFDSIPPTEGSVYLGRRLMWARAQLPGLQEPPRLRAILSSPLRRSEVASGTPDKIDHRLQLLDLTRHSGDVHIIVQALDSSGKEAMRWSGARQLTHPHPAKLAKSFPIRFVQNDDHTYYFVRIGDLDNDGRLDYLISRGTVHQEAYDHDGRLLWEHHNPDANLKDVRADSDVRIYDIDNDGASEAIVARRIGDTVYLCIVDGRTGEIERKIPYPGIEKRRDRSSINIANLTGGPRASEILVSWDYTYIAAFDAQLNLLWEGPADMGQHTPKVADVDGDGKDEVLCSTDMLDHNGKLLWSQRDLPTIRSVSMGSYKRDDVDSPILAEIDGNTKNGPEVFFSTGGTLLTVHGQPIWSLGESVFHGQHAEAGRVFPGRDGTRILLVDWRDRGMYNAARAVSLVDARGNTDWTVEGSSWASLGDWTGNGLSDVFLGDGYVVDGEGNILAEVPDFFSNVVICDVMGDQREEFILARVSMRDQTAQLEIYTNAAENRNPLTSRVPEKKTVSQRILNWTCY